MNKLTEEERLALVEVCLPIEEQMYDDGRLRRGVQIRPEFDCMRFPCVHGDAACAAGDPGQNHGRSGRSIFFSVAAVGLGAVVFELFTPIYLEGTPDPRPYHPLGPLFLHNQHRPSYYDDDDKATLDCSWVDEGAPCWGDATYLEADAGVAALMAGGVPGVWAWLGEKWLPSLTS